jgi:hypothetical protein
MSVLFGSASHEIPTSPLRILPPLIPVLLRSELGGDKKSIQGGHDQGEKGSMSTREERRQQSPRKHNHKKGIVKVLISPSSQAHL